MFLPQPHPQQRIDRTGLCSSFLIHHPCREDPTYLISSLHAYSNSILYSDPLSCLDSCVLGLTTSPTILCLHQRWVESATLSRNQCSQCRDVWRTRTVVAAPRTQPLSQNTEEQVVLDLDPMRDAGVGLMLAQHVRYYSISQG